MPVLRHANKSAVSRLTTVLENAGSYAVCSPRAALHSLCGLLQIRLTEAVDGVQLVHAGFFTDVSILKAFAV